MPGEMVAQNIVKGLSVADCQRLVVTGGHCGIDASRGQNVIDNSSLNSTYIFMPWLRDNSKKQGYEIVGNNAGQQITRHGVASFITNLVKQPDQDQDQNIAIA